MKPLPTGLTRNSRSSHFTIRTRSTATCGRREIRNAAGKLMRRGAANCESKRHGRNWRCPTRPVDLESIGSQRPLHRCQSAGLLLTFRSMCMRPNASCSAMQVKPVMPVGFPAIAHGAARRIRPVLVQAGRSPHRRQKPRETFSPLDSLMVRGAEEVEMGSFIHAATRWDGMSAAAQPSRCVIR